jgi:predicted deacylase
MNALDVPTLVVEMGVGMRLTPNYGRQLTEGIFNLMKALGIWTGEVVEPRVPVVSERAECIAYLNAPMSGMFLKEKSHGVYVAKGERLGMIFNPYTGEELQSINAPVTGLLFTIREYPVVDEGSLLARICVVEAE